MDEYIKRDAALLAISYYPIENPEPGDIIPAVLETARKAIAKINAADVATVRRGRWNESQRLHYGAKQYECSLCWEEAFWDKHRITEKYPCCPNCGAKMDLEV